MKVLELLRKRNRTLLEMHLGLLFCGLLCQGVGALIVEDQAGYAKSLWFGIVLAGASAVHMYRSLDRALDFEASAAKMILRDYMIRYVLIAVILLIITVMEVLNPLIVFLAYMCLKVTAFIQPITHKLCNKMFHETDPIPEAMPEVDETSGEAGQPAEGTEAAGTETL